MIGLTYEQLTELKPCSDSLKRITKLMGGVKKWSGKSIDASSARAAGATLDDIVWAASALACTDKDVERRLRFWAADCAACVLHFFEYYFPADDRPRTAILAARQLARGEIDDAAWAARAARAAWDAWAASDPSDASAAWAARAAWDASAASDASAVWAAWAARAAWDAWAASDPSDASLEAEEQWQFDRLILWLSDNEPEDWPLPEREDMR